MTVCCVSSPMRAKRGGSSPSPSLRASDVSVTRRRVSCKRFRSTKGASKARRDQINAEIRSMRRLLPVSPDDQDRLSYLHSMSAICTYVRKALFFQELWPKEEESSCLPYGEFLQALPGFIVAFTREGKLIYVSENVTEYLGFSMVDLLQGDSFYSMVERKEVNLVKSHLEDHSADAMETAFVCRMHASKSLRARQAGGCTMLVRGRFQSVPQSSAARPDLDRAFVALCTPTADRLRDDDLHQLSQGFRTVHRADMSFTRACESVPFYLGYSSEQMIGRSWYSLLHPEDLVLGMEAHKALLQVNDGTPVEMVLRLQCVDLSWKRLYIRAARDSGKQTVTCTNHIISEAEAEFLVQNIHGTSGCRHLQKSVHLHQGNRAVSGLKRQRSPSSPHKQPQNKPSGLADPEVSYTVLTNQACEEGASLADHSGAMSPPSSHSPGPSRFPALQQEEAESDFLQEEEEESDFLQEMYDPEELFSLQEGLPSYLSFQDSGCGPSVPRPASQSLQPIVGHLSAIDAASARSPVPCPSPSLSYDFPSCPADTRLVPDSLLMPAAFEGLLDCSFHPEVLVQPTNDSASTNYYFIPLPAHALPVTPDPAPPLTPDPSPSLTSGVGSSGVSPYSQREQEEISILAWQISSMASSFDTYRIEDQARSLGSGYERASPDRIEDQARSLGSGYERASPDRIEDQARSLGSGYERASPDRIEDQARSLGSGYERASPDRIEDQARSLGSGYERASPDRSEDQARSLGSGYERASPDRIEDQARSLGSGYERASPDRIEDQARSLGSGYERASPDRIEDQARSLGSGYERASPERSACGCIPHPPAQVTCATGPTFRWSPPTPHPIKPELALDEGVFDCFLKDLGRLPRMESPSCSGPAYCSGPASICGPVGSVGSRSGQQAIGATATINSDFLSFSALVEDLSHEQPLGGATAPDAHVLTTGPQENIELNQLNHYIHRDLHQQGKFSVRYTQV